MILVTFNRSSFPSSLFDDIQLPSFPVPTVPTSSIKSNCISPLSFHLERFCNPHCRFGHFATCFTHFDFSTLELGDTFPSYVIRHRCALTRAHRLLLREANRARYLGRTEYGVPTEVPFHHNFQIFCLQTR